MEFSDVTVGTITSFVKLDIYFRPFKSNVLVEEVT